LRKTTINSLSPFTGSLVDSNGRHLLLDLELNGRAVHHLARGNALVKNNSRFLASVNRNRVGLSFNHNHSALALVNVHRLVLAGGLEKKKTKESESNKQKQTHSQFTLTTTGSLVWC
jgi:hypothetical protein